MNPRTYTHTWTKTRLEAIQDQVHKLLLYAGIPGNHIETVLKGVEAQDFCAVAVYGKDADGLRIVEVVLTMDWSAHQKLTLVVPNIIGDLPGWQEDEAPEVRVAGYRFAEVVKKLELSTWFWARFTPAIKSDPPLYESMCQQYGFTGKAPKWRDNPEMREDALIELPELTVEIRKAGHG
jgi:hypothetical protein